MADVYKPITDVPDILQKIIEVKKQEVDALRSHVSEEDLKEKAMAAHPALGFRDSLVSKAKETSHVALIAEVKKASPSKGIIREDFDPVDIASQYSRGGAACLSVLTDEQFFCGNLSYIQQAKDVAKIPILRKDFMIDPIQVYEAAVLGADAILLIAACLHPEQMVMLHRTAEEVGLDVLVEIHDAQEWEMVVQSGLNPPLVGINNRNLRDFTLTLQTTDDLAPRVLESGAFLVAESGIFTPQDVKRVKDSGAGAILVGESLMRQENVEQAVRDLLQTV